MVEIGNCVDCAFLNFKWDVKDMEKKIPLFYPWGIEITLNILEGNCVMYKQSPAYVLLMEKTRMRKRHCEQAVMKLFRR